MKNHMRAILAICIAAACTTQASYAQGFGYFNYNHHYNFSSPSYGTGIGYASPATYAAPVAAYAPVVSYAPIAAAPVNYGRAAYAPAVGYGHVQAAPTYSLRLVRRYAVRRPKPVVVHSAPSCNVCEPAAIISQ